jgi:hypothetical protein
VLAKVELSISSTPMIRETEETEADHASFDQPRTLA